MNCQRLVEQSQKFYRVIGILKGEKKTPQQNIWRNNGRKYPQFGERQISRSKKLSISKEDKTQNKMTWQIKLLKTKTKIFLKAEKDGN